MYLYNAPVQYVSSDQTQCRHTYQLRYKTELCAKCNEFKTRDLIFVYDSERMTGFTHAQR